MSTFRQDPVDRDSARVAGDLRTLRQRITGMLDERRAAVRADAVERAFRTSSEPADDRPASIEEAPELVEDRELVSH